MFIQSQKLVKQKAHSNKEYRYTLNSVRTSRTVQNISLSSFLMRPTSYNCPGSDIKPRFSLLPLMLEDRNNQSDDW